METDELEPNSTIHTYVNQLLVLTGSLLEETRDTGCYSVVDEITEKMDEILIEMRHADWQREIG